MKTCLQYLREMHEVCRFMSTDGRTVGPASNSELKRWFDDRKIQINFEIKRHDDPLPPVIKSVVISPKNEKKRCTLYYDASITLLQIEEPK